MTRSGVLMCVDEHGHVVEWTRLAEDLLHKSPGDALGRAVGTLLSDSSGPGQNGGLRSAPWPSVRIRPKLCDGHTTFEVLTGDDDTPSQADYAVLRAAFAQQTVGLHVLDDQLRVVTVSTGTSTMRETPVEHVIGRRFVDVLDLEHPEAEEATAREVLHTGVPVTNRLIRGGAAEGGRTRRVYSVTTMRLENDGGEILGLLASVVDVTERERTRRGVDILGAVRERVGRRLDVIAVCGEFVDAVAPTFTGIVVVEVVDAVVRGEDPPLAPVDPDVPLRRAAFRGVVSAHPVGDIRHLPYGTPFTRVLADLRPRLVPVDETSPWLAADPHRAEAIRLSAVHSLLVVPLELRGEVFGVVSFYRHEGEDPFAEDDIALATDICAHTVLCIDNARRYARERAIAATVQRRSLPQRPANLSTVEISPLFLTGPEGGGAWYDAIPLPSARTALIVGDVAGHGIAATTAMGQLRTALYSLAALDLGADELMARLNDTVVRLAAERAWLPVGDPLQHEPLTARCVIAIYDPVGLTCTIARAGLPEPLLVDPHGSSRVLATPEAPLLAGSDDAPFATATVPLPDGSVLAMETSSLADHILAPAGLLRGVLERGAGRDLRELCDVMTYALQAGNSHDEALLLLARTKRIPPHSVHERDLPADTEAAPMARATVRDQMERWRVDDETAYTTELLASELVGNAVRYGEPPLSMRLILDRVLTCEVTDAAMSAPHVRHARTVDETGRGLFIVTSLAQNWGTRYHEDGKTVWAELPAGPGGANRSDPAPLKRVRDLWAG
ncbi:SpoIIE family protein phosphatase [Streptomyces sp. NPDC003720]|uniref:SpoIIE family protein phosphatase n=1 Tax=Streptomyces sp. NPDC003720 TaxID=3364684 RepID=UPI0036C1A772